MSSFEVLSGQSVKSNILSFIFYVSRKKKNMSPIVWAYCGYFTDVRVRARAV